jgi:hypothetical protein
MAIITSANLASAIVKLVAADALPALEGAFILGNLVNRDYEPMLANAGDTVNVPLPPTLVANNLAEGGSVQTQNPNLGNAQIVLNRHIEATFQIPDVTKALATPDLFKVYMNPAVIAIATQVETDLLNAYALFTQNTVLGSAATPVTESVLDSAESQLFLSKVPPGTPKYLICDSNTYSVIRQIPRFSSWQNNGQEGINALIQGEVGKVKDLYVFRSQNVPTTGAGPISTHNFVFVKDALGLVVRRLPQPLPGTGAIAEYAEKGNFGVRVTMSYQPNTLAQQFTVDILYGIGMLRNGFGVQLLS